MIRLSKERSSLDMFVVSSTAISKEPTLNLNIYIKYAEEGKGNVCLTVVKLIQGYTLVRSEHEDTTKYLLDIKLFSEIFEKAKEELPGFESLFTQIPLFV